LSVLILLGLVVLAFGCRRVSPVDKLSVMIGGPDVITIIRAPEKVELFPTLYTFWMETNGSGSVPPNMMDKVGAGTNLPTATVSEITQLLLSPASYPPTNYMRNDVFEPEVILRFTKGKKVVEFVLSVGSGHAILQTGHT